VGAQNRVEMLNWRVELASTSECDGADRPILIPAFRMAARPPERPSGRLARAGIADGLPLARRLEGRVEWPRGALDVWPQRPEALFAGDAVHAAAWFADEPQGEATSPVSHEGRIVDRPPDRRHRQAGFPACRRLLSLWRGD